MKKRILIIGTRTWELTSIHLKYFVDAKANIVGFLESPTDTITSTTSGGSINQPIHEVAAELDLPIIQSGDPKDPAIHEWIANLAPDIIVVIGYQFLLPKEFLELAPLGVVNFHTSLLPRHCGRHPGFWTIWYGDKYSGMTVHQMDEGLDTGAVLYRNLVPVENGDTVDSLYQRIWNHDKELVEMFLNELESKDVLGDPSVLEELDDYSYNYVPSEQDFELDFRYDAQTNANRCSMKPGAFYVTVDGMKVVPTKYHVLKEPIDKRNFKIQTPYIYKDWVVYMTSNGWFAIEEVEILGETHTGAAWATKAKRIAS